jgi:hypothetical protein
MGPQPDLVDHHRRHRDLVPARAGRSGSSCSVTVRTFSKSVVMRAVSSSTRANSGSRTFGPGIEALPRCPAPGGVATIERIRPGTRPGPEGQFRPALTQTSMCSRTSCSSPIARLRRPGRYLPLWRPAASQVCSRRTGRRRSRSIDDADRDALCAAPLTGPDLPPPLRHVHTRDRFQPAPRGVPFDKSHLAGRLQGRVDRSGNDTCPDHPS